MASGGSANLYGVLYQILQTLSWTLNFHLRSTDVEKTSITLILEPRFGGDLQIAFPTHRLVQQHKTRSGDRTWSLTDVVNDVLPDLYLSVEHTNSNDRFEFITDARMGRWRGALRFFQ